MSFSNSCRQPFVNAGVCQVAYIGRQIQTFKRGATALDNNNIWVISDPRDRLEMYICRVRSSLAYKAWGLRGCPLEFLKIISKIEFGAF